MGIGAGRIGLVAAAAILAGFPAGAAQAANGAYAVDAADISEVGSCKIESWLSAATNTDFSAVANPSCVVDPFKPVEFSMNMNRARSDGEWSNTFAPKAKTNIMPTGIGKLGFSFYAGGSFDALTGDNLTAFAVVPATFRLNENMRLNFNGGWLWDRSVDRHYLHLRHRLRLEVHGNLAMDHRSLWAGGPIRDAKRGPAAVPDRRALPA